MLGALGHAVVGQQNACILRLQWTSRVGNTSSVLLGKVSEESGSQLNTYAWFFRPDHRQLQRLSLAGLMEQSCPPHTMHWLERLACACRSLKRFAIKDSGFLACPTLSHIYILSPVTFIPRSPSEAFHQGPFQVLLLRTSFWVRRGELEDTFPPLTQYLILFHFQSFSSPSSEIRIHRTPGAFSAELPQKWDEPYVWLIYLTLNQLVFHRGT